MEAVTSEYLEQMARPIRNPSYIKIKYGLVDPQAQPTSEITTTDDTEYSDPNSIDLEYSIDKKYGRMMDNSLILNGTFTAVPDADNFDYQGLVSEAITGADGTGSFPLIDVDFDGELIRFGGLTFRFDRLGDNYPLFVTVKSYLDGTLVDTITADIDSVDFVTFQYIPSDGYCDQMTMEFSGSKFPYRDLLIEQITFGINYEFEDADIETVTFKHSVDLVGLTLPTETMEFTFFDTNGDFKEDNTDSKFSFIESRQTLESSLGYELDDGTIEWVSMGEHLTTGEVEGYADLDMAKLTLSAQSLLSSMTETYSKGVYSSTAKTLYALATEVIEDYGLEILADGSEQWVFDETQMSQFTTKQPITSMPYNEALQLLASASGCVLYTGRDGKIHIEPREYDLDSDFHYDYAKIKEAPTRVTYPVLRNVIVTYQNVSLEDSGELTTLDVDESSATTVNVSYSASTNHTYTASGVTVSSATFYADNAVFVVTGTGTITISGQQIAYTDVTYTKAYQSYGEDCEVDSTFVDSSSHADTYADFIAGFMKMKNEYSIEDRGNPEIDPLDTITAQTGFSDNAEVVVTSNEITYNGTLSGATTYYLKVT